MELLLNYTTKNMINFNMNFNKTIKKNNSFVIKVDPNLEVGAMINIAVELTRNNYDSDIYKQPISIVENNIKNISVDDVVKNYELNTQDIRLFQKQMDFLSKENINEIEFFKKMKKLENKIFTIEVFDDGVYLFNDSKSKIDFFDKEYSIDKVRNKDIFNETKEILNIISAYKSKSKKINFHEERIKYDLGEVSVFLLYGNIFIFKNYSRNSDVNKLKILNKIKEGDTFTTEIEIIEKDKLNNINNSINQENYLSKKFNENNVNYNSISKVDRKHISEINMLKIEGVFNKNFSEDIVLKRKYFTENKVNDMVLIHSDSVKKLYKKTLKVFEENLLEDLLIRSNMILNDLVFIDRNVNYNTKINNFIEIDKDSTRIVNATKIFNLDKESIFDSTLPKINKMEKRQNNAILTKKIFIENKTSSKIKFSTINKGAFLTRNKLNNAYTTKELNFSKEEINKYTAQYFDFNTFNRLYQNNIAKIFSTNVTRKLGNKNVFIKREKTVKRYKNKITNLYSNLNFSKINDDEVRYYTSVLTADNTKNKFLNYGDYVTIKRTQNNNSKINKFPSAQRKQLEKHINEMKVLYFKNETNKDLTLKTFKAIESKESLRSKKMYVDKVLSGYNEKIKSVFYDYKTELGFIRTSNQNAAYTDNFFFDRSKDGDVNYTKVYSAKRLYRSNIQIDRVDSVDNKILKNIFYEENNSVSKLKLDNLKVINTNYVKRKVDKTIVIQDELSANNYKRRTVNEIKHKSLYRKNTSETNINENLKADKKIVYDLNNFRIFNSERKNKVNVNLTNNYSVENKTLKNINVLNILNPNKLKGRDVNYLKIDMANNLYQRNLNVNKNNSITKHYENNVIMQEFKSINRKFEDGYFLKLSINDEISAGLLDRKELKLFDFKSIESKNLRNLNLDIKSEYVSKIDIGKMSLFKEISTNNFKRSNLYVNKEITSHKKNAGDIYLNNQFKGIVGVKDYELNIMKNFNVYQDKIRHMVLYDSKSIDIEKEVKDYVLLKTDYFLDDIKENLRITKQGRFMKNNEKDYNYFHRINNITSLDISKEILDASRFKKGMLLERNEKDLYEFSDLKALDYKDLKDLRIMKKNLKLNKVIQEIVLEKSLINFDLINSNRDLHVMKNKKIIFSHSHRDFTYFKDERINKNDIEKNFQMQDLISAFSKGKFDSKYIKFRPEIQKISKEINKKTVDEFIFKNINKDFSVFNNLVSINKIIKGFRIFKDNINIDNYNKDFSVLSTEFVYKDFNKNLDIFDERIFGGKIPDLLKIDNDLISMNLPDKELSILESHNIYKDHTKELYVEEKMKSLEKEFIDSNIKDQKEIVVSNIVKKDLSIKEIKEIFSQKKYKDLILNIEVFAHGRTNDEYDKFFSNVAKDGTDELLLPKSDFDYSKFAKEVVDENGNPIDPVRETEDGHFISKLPLTHPMENIYEEIQKEFLLIDVSVMKYLIEATYFIWKKNIFSFGSTDMKSAVEDLMDRLDKLISLKIPHDLQDQGYRVLRLIRWYGEAAIVNNAEYKIINQYEESKSDMYTGEFKLPHTKENLKVTSGYVLGLIDNTKNASLTLDIENKRDGLLQFTYQSTNGVIEISINDEQPTVYRNNYDTKKIFLEKGSNEVKIEFINNDTGDNGIFKISNVITPFTKYVKSETEYVADLSKGNLIIDEMLRKASIYTNVLEDNTEFVDELISGNIAIGDIIDRLINYYDKHHLGNKVKGKRKTIRK